MRSRSWPHSEHYFRTFYSRRALRIFPPYYLALAIYLGISIACGKPGPWKMWLSFVFYYSSFFKSIGPELLRGSVVPGIVAGGLAVLWSLSVEELYYTVWAPLVRYTSEWVFTCVLVAMIVVAPVLRWWLHTPGNMELVTVYCRMDGLAYGSAIALLTRHRRLSPGFAQRWDGLFDGLMVAFLVIAVIGGAIWGGAPTNIWGASAGITIADLCFASVVFAMVRKAGGSQWWVRMFRAKWLRSIGMVSYSLYLFHEPIFSLSADIVFRLHLSRRLNISLIDGLGFVASLAVAYGLWYGMESRILRWKDRKIPSPAHVEAQIAQAVPMTR